MSEIKPRFEFRTFAQEFGIVETKLRKASPVDKIRESSEIYILSGTNSENNTKVRDDLMDIKVFVQRNQGLEQWNPRMKGSFPMKRETIEREVFPAFAVTPPKYARDEYTLAQFLDELILPHPDLVAARVMKRRFGFLVNDCICELADLLINGAAIRTCAIESVDVDAILRTRRQLGLDEYENVNYLRAIKRITGLEPLPE